MKRYTFYLLIPPLFIFYASDGAADPMFCGYHVSTLDRVLDKAGDEVHQIVDTLNKQAGDNPYEERYAIFEGEPGSGKSTLAISVAHATKRKPDIHSASEYLGGSRNEGAKKLSLQFTALHAAKKKTIFIIEEVNRLLNHYDSEHHDTDTASMCLWTELDKLKTKDKRKRIFFIGTMNGVGGLPPQIRSRWQDTILTIEPLHDADITFNDIMKGLMRGNPEMSSEISDYFSANKERFKELNGRDVEKLVFKIRSKAYKRDKPFVITMDHVKAGEERISSLVERMVAETPESDRDQRERHHQESIAMHKKGIAVGVGVAAFVAANAILPVVGGVICIVCGGVGYKVGGALAERNKKSE